MRTTHRSALILGFLLLLDTIGHTQENTVAGNVPNANTYREGIVCAIPGPVNRASLAAEFERAVGNRSEQDRVDKDPTEPQTYAAVTRFIEKRLSDVVCARINASDGQYSITTPSAGFYTIVWVLSGGHGKPTSQVYRSYFRTGEPILSFHQVPIIKSQ